MRTPVDSFGAVLPDRISTVGLRHVRICCVAMLALSLCGCSSFNRAWKQAANAPTPPDSIEGRWEGHWLSAKNGHNGNLRCLITKEAEGPYAARFRASYLKVLRFSYTVPLEVTRSNDVWHFQGEADLGKIGGGIYRYVGTTTTTHFHSTYDSKYDHGDFEMSRPADGQSPTGSATK